MTSYRCSRHVSAVVLLLLVDCQSVQAPYDDGKSWGMAEQIGSGTGIPPFSPQVATDAAGNAIAVWSHNASLDVTDIDIWFNRYTPREGWGTEERIGADVADSAVRPQVAMDPNGNAIAVWQQTEGLRLDIWSNRHTAGVGWGAEERIETDDRGAALVPQIAIDPNGNGVAVWQQFDGTRFSIWANRYVPDEGWARAEPVETDDVADAVAPQIAMDPAGNAIAVWQQFDGTRFNIWSKRYTPSGGWGTLQPVETDNSGEAEGPQIALDAQGNGIAVWQQSDGERFDIWSSRYAPSDDRWSTAERIETDDVGDSSLPQVAVSPNGTAVAVWARLGETSFDVWSNRFEPDRGWGTAERIDDGGQGDARSPQVAMNAQQSAVTVWIQPHDGQDRIFSNRYSPSGGWGTPQVIAAQDRLIDQPRVAVDPEGNAVAIWTELTEFAGVWSTRLESAPSSPLPNGEPDESVIGHRTR